MIKKDNYKKILNQIIKLQRDLERIERYINIVKLNTILKLKKYNNNL